MDFTEKLTYISSELKPIVINNRPQCNREYVYCECALKHAHKYTWYQAESGGCRTCTLGTSRQKKARRYAELKFGKVFQTMEDNLSVNFKSETERVVLQFGDIDNIEEYAKYKIIDLRNCLLKKCRQQIRHESLRMYEKGDVPIVGHINPLFDGGDWDPYIDNLEAELGDI